MPRLFIAIDFPEFIKEQLLELYDLSIDSANWVDSEQLHLTLRFIGEVDGILFDDIRETLSEIRESAFSIAFKGVGFFPPRKHPRVLWAGIDKNDALHQLKKKIDHKLERLRLPADKRKFHPHITLARLKNTPLDTVGTYLCQYNLFKTESFPVKEFSLYSSLLSSQGAIHTQEALYPLLPRE